ncbi:PDDEXK nuclease domain-containing protein [Pseudomonas helleri]|uniref:PDDEXK nuclease domain-containing protein n=1 Tax=Pseudomonas helleri TaxID=1608996 RepID=UPI003D13BC18
MQKNNHDFPGPAETNGFAHVVKMIKSAQQSAAMAVNAHLIELYWQVGAFISQKLEHAEWGDSVVEQLAAHIAHTQPGLRGFTRRNLFRMRQFYEAYKAEEHLVSALLTQMPWTHHLMLLSQCSMAQQRAFYMRTAIAQKWSSRELGRQLQSALFERTIIQPAKLSPALKERIEDVTSIFKDAYVLEFLQLLKGHSESGLHQGLLGHLKAFLTELGHDFCFVGSQYPLQVGARDFVVDLVLFHRGLNCLVAIELKVGRFEPEHLGKLNFYLEALDRDHRKPHENPAIGVLLCASKEDEVVEYALNRSLSPALIAEYQTHLPDKKLLQAKLHEFYLQNVPVDDA